uniref:Uncharacterized protein n=1 Tax=Arundo donax TaxID=35708 RepID=A0A0A8XRL0_ARUDO
MCCLVGPFMFCTDLQCQYHYYYKKLPVCLVFIAAIPFFPLLNIITFFQ